MKRFTTVVAVVAVVVAVAVACTDAELAAVDDFLTGDPSPVPPSIPAPGATAGTCSQPVAVVYHAAGEPYPARADLQTAAARLSDGLAGRPVVVTVDGAAPAGAARFLDVRWSTTLDPSRYLGVTRTTSGSPSADIELASRARLAPGDVAGGYVVLYMHEMAHGVGVGHVDDPDAVMHSGLRSTIAPSWTAEERLLLAASPYACPDTPRTGVAPVAAPGFDAPHPVPSTTHP